MFSWQSDFVMTIQITRTVERRRRQTVGRGAVSVTVAYGVHLCASWGMMRHRELDYVQISAVTIWMLRDYSFGQKYHWPTTTFWVSASSMSASSIDSMLRHKQRNVQLLVPWALLGEFYGASDTWISVFAPLKLIGRSHSHRAKYRMMRDVMHRQEISNYTVSQKVPNFSSLITSTYMIFIIIDRLTGTLHEFATRDI